MAKLLIYLRLGLIVLVCTAIYEKIAKAGWYDTQTRLSVFQGDSHVDNSLY